MEVEVLPVSSLASREAAQVLGLAFTDDPLVTAVLRGLPSDERIKRLKAMFIAELSACVRRGCPLAVMAGDKILAAAIIYPPGTYPLPLHEQVKVVVKGIAGAGFYGLVRLLRVVSDFKKHHPKERHYYFECMGVEPCLQGRGFGSAIFRHLVQRADDDHVGCYLENPNPRNVPLYQRFGFQIVRKEPVIGVPVWFMWRPPIGGSRGD
jgi:GNAT superfamily N-acetyltransferase